MDDRQEPKYCIRPERWSHGELIPAALVNRSTGEAIPPDEPVFVLRGRDLHSTAAIAFYLAAVSDDRPQPDHVRCIEARLAQFQKFAAENPQRMKYPDSTVDDVARAEVAAGGG